MKMKPMKKYLFVLLMFLISVPAAAQQVADCGCEDKPLPEVLGVVNGVKISKQDLSPETLARVEQWQRQVVEARERELDLQIDSMLLESEAKKRGVTPSQVIKDESLPRPRRRLRPRRRPFTIRTRRTFKRNSRM